MHMRSSAQRLALAGAATLVAGLLVPAPAHAAPVFTSAELDNYVVAHDHSGNCTVAENATPGTDNVPVVENGPAVTYSGSVSSTFQHDGEPTDTATATVSGTVSTKVTSVGANLDSIEMTSTGSGAFDAALPTSGCDAHLALGGYAEFEFVVTEAGWLTITSQGPSASYSEFELNTDANANEQTYSYKFKHKATKTLFLTPGTYTGNIEADLDIETSTDRTFSGETSVKATFAVAGSQTAAPVGKGKKYVTLGARSCTANTVAAAITSKGKRADKVDKVSFLVNGKRVLKDGKPKKGETYNVPVANDADAEVTAVVKLLKPKPGKPAKTVDVTSSHVACS